MANNIFGGSVGPVVSQGASSMNAAGSIGPRITPSISGMSPQINVIYVDDMQQVLDHPRTPNEHLFFPEKNNNIIWVRETDANAEIKNPIKRLTYTEDAVAFGPEANFVTKSEHQELYNLVAGMNATLNRLMDELGGSSK